MTTTEAKWLIVVLDRNWVFVGRHTRTQEGRNRLEKAQCIRRWGTTGGLAQLATTGPQEDTKLEPACTVEYWDRVEIVSFDTSESLW